MADDKTTTKIAQWRAVRLQDAAGLEAAILAAEIDQREGDPDALLQRIPRMQGLADLIQWDRAGRARSLSDLGISELRRLRDEDAELLREARSTHGWDVDECARDLADTEGALAEAVAHE